MLDIFSVLFALDIFKFPVNVICLIATKLVSLDILNLPDGAQLS